MSVGATIAEKSEVAEATFTPAQFLPFFTEPSPLNFMTSEAKVVACTQADKSTSFSLTFDHAPLGYRGLFNLLATTAPYKPEQNIPDVRTDWSIQRVERRYRENGTDPAYGGWITGVLKYHERFGAAWTDFIDGSREIFDEILSDEGDYFTAPDGTYIYTARDGYPGLISRAAVSSRWAAGVYAHVHSPKTIAELAKGLQAAGVEADETVILTSLKLAMSHSSAMRKRNRSAYRAAQHIYETTSPAKRSEYIRSVVAQLPRSAGTVYRECSQPVR